MTIWTRTFWAATLERVVSTAAQTALALIGADTFVDLLEVDGGQVAGVAAGAALVSLLKCLAASRLGDNPGPSLVSAEELAPQGL